MAEYYRITASRSLTPIARRKAGIEAMKWNRDIFSMLFENDEKCRAFIKIMPKPDLFESRPSALYYRRNVNA
jgi:hypothetical protein